MPDTHEPEEHHTCMYASQNDTVIRFPESAKGFRLGQYVCHYPKGRGVCVILEDHDEPLVLNISEEDFWARIRKVMQC